jgi:hypothetical protein
MNGKQYLVAAIGIVLVTMSIFHDWRPEMDAILFGK